MFLVLKYYYNVYHVECISILYNIFLTHMFAKTKYFKQVVRRGEPDSS